MGNIYRAYLAVARAGGVFFLSMSIAALQGNPIVTSRWTWAHPSNCPPPLQGKLNENKKKMAKVDGYHSRAGLTLVDIT